MEVLNGPNEDDGYFYINGVKQRAYQVVEFEDAFYYVGNYNKYLVNQRVFVEARLLEGTSLKAGWYYCDENGKMTPEK